MLAVKVAGTDEIKTWMRKAQIANREKFLLTSGPDQFRLPLHPFAHYDFTVDWGDGTTEIVRSDAAAGQAMVDENWLAQAKNGLDKSVTFETIDRYDPRNCAHDGRFYVAVDNDDGGAMSLASGSRKKNKKLRAI